MFIHDKISMEDFFVLSLQIYDGPLDYVQHVMRWCWLARERVTFTF